jgi:hypothetical protein
LPRRVAFAIWALENAAIGQGYGLGRSVGEQKISHWEPFSPAENLAETLHGR